MRIKNTVSIRLSAVSAALFFFCQSRLPGQDYDKSELFNYIQSGHADPSCGICLTSSKKRLAERAKAELDRKTAGMARVPAGEYKVGSEKGRGEPDELPRHAVMLDAFFLDKREVSISDYLNFAKATRGNYPEWAQPDGKFNLETGADKYYQRLGELIKTCPSCPVFGVSWTGADAYCRWEKKRLPTEAEWETAAAAGSSAKFSFGDSEADADVFSWYEGNSGGIPHRTGSKLPNAFGLYDMYGNVWEWVHDFYDREYYKTSVKKDPEGPEAGREHVVRGGAWSSSADEMSTTNRGSSDKPNDDIGFRCAISERDLVR